MNPFDLLNSVKDKESFVAFVRALAEERERAEAMEREEPVYYRLGGALDWQNGEISAFLFSALEYFEDGPHRFSGQTPTWRDMAEFLYFGKIYE